jgi:hypothetical protein
LKEVSFVEEEGDAPLVDDFEDDQVEVVEEDKSYFLYVCIAFL